MLQASAQLIVVVRLLSHVRLFAALWTAAHQASLSFTILQSLLKLMSIESMMPSNHLILCHPHLLLPSVFPNIRIFSNELALSIRWPKYWSFSFSNSLSNGYSVLIPLGLTGWYPCSPGRSLHYLSSRQSPKSLSPCLGAFVFCIKGITVYVPLERLDLKSLRKGKLAK